RTPDFADGRSPSLMPSNFPPDQRPSRAAEASTANGWVRACTRAGNGPFVVASHNAVAAVSAKPPLHASSEVPMVLLPVTASSNTALADLICNVVTRRAPLLQAGDQKGRAASIQFRARAPAARRRDHFGGGFSQMIDPALRSAGPRSTGTTSGGVRAESPRRAG